MKVNFGWQMLVVMIVAGAAIYFFVTGKNVFKKLVTKTLNPASDQNLAYRGSNAVTQAIVGNDVDTTGTAIYNSTHDDCGNLKWPWQASSPCTFKGAFSEKPPEFGKPSVPAKPVFIYRGREFPYGTSEGE